MKLHAVRELPFAFALAVTLASSAAQAAVLYDNGTIITSATGGFGGAALSRCNLAVNTLGMNSFTYADGRNSKVADNFTVGAGGWSVSSITGFGLIQDSNYPNPPVTSPVTGCLFEIWNGTPENGGPASVIASSTVITSNTWSGTYRTRSTGPSDRDAPVWAVTVDFGSLVLGPGTYWVSFNYTGLSPQNNESVLTPFIMSVSGTTRTTVSGDGRNWFNSQQDSFGWRTTEVGSSVPQGVEYPFVVSGTQLPTPGAAAVLGLGALAATRRRRR